jgi:hypothetical protein
MINFVRPDVFFEKTIQFALFDRHAIINMPDLPVYTRKRLHLQLSGTICLEFIYLRGNEGKLHAGGLL